MKKGIIDYGKSEEIIVNIENIFKGYDLTLDEKLLIMRFLSDRLAKLKQKDMATDILGKIPMAGFAKKILGDLGKDE